MKKIYFLSIGLWVLFAVVASLNGYMRNVIYRPLVGDLVAHQISTALFVSLTLAMMYVFFNKLGLEYTRSDLWIVGASWTISTIIFEFVFGHFVFGNPWEKLFFDYNIFQGRIWMFVLVFTFFGPIIVGKNEI